MQVISSGRTKFILDIRISILPGATSKRFDKRGIDRGIDRWAFRSRIRFTNLQEMSKTGRGKLSNDPFLRESPKDWSKYKRSATSELRGDSFYRLHRKKVKTKIKEKDLNESFDFDDNFSPDLNDYLTEEALSALTLLRNNSSSSPQRDSSTPQIGSVGKPKSKISETKSGKKKNYRRKNEILNSEDIRAKGALKNPIFIRPLGSSSDLQDDLKPRHIQVPYNYLDAFWEPEDFTLQIKYTRASDAGTYLCQINTEPRMTQVVHLRVVGKYYS